MLSAHNADYRDTGRHDVTHSTALPTEVTKLLRQAAINAEVIPQGVNNAWDAFCIIAENGPLAVLTKADCDFAPAKSIKQALIELAYPCQAAKLTIAIILGCAAALSFGPSGKAAGKIADIMHLTEKSKFLAEVMKLAMQSVAASENLSVTAYTSKMILDHLTHRERDRTTANAKSYLNYHDLNLIQKITRNIRGIFNHAAGGASALTIFFITQQTLGFNPILNYILGGLAGAANYAPYVTGTAGLPLTPSRIEPARRVLINYIKRQMKHFMALGETQQKTIFAKFQDFEDLTTRADRASMQTGLTYLFNITALADEEAPIMNQCMAGCRERTHLLTESIEVLYAALVGAGGAAGYLYGAFESGENLPPKFPLEGVSTLALSFIPTIGLGYVGGKYTAHTILSDDINLAKKYAPIISRILRLIVLLASPFAGGTNFYLNYSFIQAVFNAIGIGASFTNTIAAIYGVTGLVSASSTNSIFTLKMLDSILLYFAKQCGDFHIRRLIGYQAAMFDLCEVIKNMTADNFRELLLFMLESGDVRYANELTVAEGEGTSSENTSAMQPLNTLLNDIFANGLSVKQYHQLEIEINSRRQLLRPAEEVFDGIVDIHSSDSSSFVDCTAGFFCPRRPGLRHRSGWQLGEERNYRPVPTASTSERKNTFG